MVVLALQEPGAPELCDAVHVGPVHETVRVHIRVGVARRALTAVIVPAHDTVQ